MPEQDIGRIVEVMKDILEKLTTYNLFNYFLPGLLFAVIGSEISSYNFVHNEIAIALFVFYFIGLIISRVGSLFLEPLLKAVSFLKFADYKDYVEASKKDSLIEELSEVNNMYRTLSAMLLSLLLFVRRQKPWDHLTRFLRDTFLHPLAPV